MVRTIRRRYIAFRTATSLPYTQWQLQRVLTASLPDPASQHPDRLRVVEYDPVSGYGILRCGHTSLAATLRHLTATCRELDIESIGVSGTLKALRRKFLPAKRGGASLDAHRPRASKTG